MMVAKSDCRGSPGCGRGIAVADSRGTSSPTKPRRWVSLWRSLTRGTPRGRATRAGTSTRYLGYVKYMTTTHGYWAA